MDPEYILVMENISKAFPSVQALDNVQLVVKKGTVHALMGENGAGKSTLMRVLIGLHPPIAAKSFSKARKWPFQIPKPPWTWASP